MSTLRRALWWHRWQVVAHLIVGDRAGATRHRLVARRLVALARVIRRRSVTGG